MKIYITSSWKNQLTVIKLANTLETEGFCVDASYRTTDKRFTFHWSKFVDSEIELNDQKVQKAFEEEKKWIDWADCVIMLMPCGKSSHLEGGYAKGQGKLLYLFGNFPNGEFEVMYQFADALYPSSSLHLMIEELHLRNKTR